MSTHTTDANERIGEQSKVATPNSEVDAMHALDVARTATRQAILDEPLPDFEVYQVLCELSDDTMLRSVEGEI